MEGVVAFVLHLYVAMPDVNAFNSREVALQKTVSRPKKPTSFKLKGFSKRQPVFVVPILVECAPAKNCTVPSVFWSLIWTKSDAIIPEFIRTVAFTPDVKDCKRID